MPAIGYCGWMPELTSTLIDHILRKIALMDSKLLDILVCPLCKSPLVYSKAAQELICKADRLAFRIEDGIPVMLVDEARKLTAEEVEVLR